jgi:hypothetical protein
MMDTRRQPRLSGDTARGGRPPRGRVADPRRLVCFRLRLRPRRGARTGIPTDHYVTFTSLAGISWDAAQHTASGTTAYVTPLERGYALHGLVFAILFLTILAIPFRGRQRWACWTPPSPTSATP